MNDYMSFFQVGDYNRTGQLNAAGLQTALNAAGEQIDYETAQVLMQTADQDGNGTIDYLGGNLSTSSHYNIVLTFCRIF